MSAKSERKARGLAQLRRQQAKKFNKKRQRDEHEDTFSANDSSTIYLPTPKELNDQENGNVRKKKKVAAPKTGSASGFSLEKVPKADFTHVKQFEREFWTGPPGQENPSEDLKQLRKNVGILVRGPLIKCPPPVINIDDPGLPTSFGEVLKQIGITKPSPIQTQCWPAALCGANILGIAPTGSGKTLAYCLPMIPQIKAHIDASSSANKQNNPPAAYTPAVALILVPTRELAIQVTTALKPLKRVCGIHSAAIYGGQDKDDQLDEVRRHGGAHIIVATPGRLLDLICAKKMSISKVTYLVIDEADRMLALGFIEQLNALSGLIRPDRQALLFSATFPGKLREVSDIWVPNAVTICCSAMELVHTGAAHAPLTESQENEGGAGLSSSAASTAAANDAGAVDSHEGQGSGEVNKQRSVYSGDTSLTISTTVSQSVHVCAAHKKPRLLIRYIEVTRENEKTEKVRQPGPMLIFCTKIKTVKFVLDFLKRQKLPADMLHGQLPQNTRERILAEFKAGKINTLIATDVAARGIHVKRLRYVVNYDFPSNLEQYCHRVGRTGRQGESGSAYSLVTRNMAPLAGDLIALMRNSGAEPEPNLLALASEFSSGSFVMDADADEVQADDGL